MTIIVVLSMILSSQLNLKQRIKKLAPGREDQNWITETIKTYAPKAGFKTEEDRNLILAMIKTESNFTHLKTPAAAGEVGALQVIPAEKHIQHQVKKYRCHKSEIGKRYFVEVKFKRGTQKMWYKPCSCSRRNSSKCNLPNILSRDRKKIRIWKTRLFLQYSKRGALATGIYEMAYWKNRYNKYLKDRFWDKYPWWYFKRQVTEDHRYITYRWWKKTKNNLDDYVWVIHYNQGGRVLLSSLARSYSHKVFTAFSKL